MSAPIIGPGGRPVAPLLKTIAPIKHCGDCHHAVLMAQPDGSIDINLLTCLEGPPQICHIPQFRPGPPVQTPGLPGGRMPGPPQFAGVMEMSKYPGVSRVMRACSRFIERTDDDRAAAAIDAANVDAEKPLEEQQSN